jgi:hypothetical protein
MAIRANTFRGAHQTVGQCRAIFCIGEPLPPP